MTRDRGSALLEVMAIGFVATLLLSQVLVSGGRLQAANEEVHAAAHAGAAHLARHGDLAAAGRLIQRSAPGAAFDLTLGSDWAQASVHRSVALVGPPGARLHGRAAATANVRRSPYGSSRG